MLAAAQPWLIIIRIILKRRLIGCLLILADDWMYSIGSHNGASDPPSKNHWNLFPMWVNSPLISSVSRPWLDWFQVQVMEFESQCSANDDDVWTRTKVNQGFSLCCSSNLICQFRAPHSPLSSSFVLFGPRGRESSLVSVPGQSVCWSVWSGQSSNQ